MGFVGTFEQYLNSSNQTFKMQKPFAEMVCGFEGERASLLLSSEVLLVQIINDHNVAKKLQKLHYRVSKIIWYCFDLNH